MPQGTIDVDGAPGSTFFDLNSRDVQGETGARRLKGTRPAT